MFWSRLGTHSGRVFLQGAAIATSFTVFGAFHLPKSLLLDKYKEFVQSYEKGVGQPVHPKAKQLYQQVLDDLQVPKMERDLLEIFTVFGFDLFHAGSTILRTGAIIGIPVNFGYDTERDVNRKIKIVTKSVDWESEAGERLRKSLVLSEDARRFALAREVTSARSVSVWLFSLYPTLAVLITYMTSRSINEHLRIRRHPSRFIMYTLSAVFSFALYCTCTDITTAIDENSSDETAAQLSPSYTQGGVEFYGKLRERNKALRELMGEQGEKVYTVSGNNVTFIRTKTTPLSERLRAMEQLAADLATEKEQSLPTIGTSN